MHKNQQLLLVNDVPFESTWQAEDTGVGLNSISLVQQARNKSGLVGLQEEKLLIFCEETQSK